MSMVLKVLDKSLSSLAIILLISVSILVVVGCLGLAVGYGVHWLLPEAMTILRELVRKK